MAVISGRSPSGSGIEITVEDGLIARIKSVEEPDPSAPWILPGLVDLQVNGYGGYDANGADVTPAVIRSMAAALARAGTTTFVPTVITGSSSAIIRSLQAIAEARRQDSCVATSIPYIHVEGPHLSDRDGPRGAHEQAHIRPPSPQEYAAWQEASDGIVGMVTLSPHWRETESYIAALVADGVRVSLGHSHAEPDDFRSAVDAGASFSTHLGNGIFATLPRHPNAIWTQLADDRLTAGFIADGHHLPEDALRAMVRAKGLERSFVVSDSVALAGAAPGRYRTPVGGEVELHRNGRLNVAGTPYLAGAALPLRAALGTLLRCGFSLREAVRLTTENPGAIAKRGGTLSVGARADVLAVRFDDHEAVVSDVWLAGERLTTRARATIQ